MVKTNIIKTKKKYRKISIFFLFFFYKIRGPFWGTSIKTFFSQIKFLETINIFFLTVKDFLLNYYIFFHFLKIFCLGIV